MPKTDYLSLVFDSTDIAGGDQHAYVDAEDPRRALSVYETKSLVCKCIAGLQAVGLNQGGSVLVVLANSILYSPIFFSIIGAGGVYLGANPASQVFELDHLIRLGEPKLVITSQDVLFKVQEACRGRTALSNNIYVLDAKAFPLPSVPDLPPSPPLSRTSNELGDEAKHELSFVNLTTYGESDWKKFDDERTAKNTPAAMFLTSGTSGLPKAAILSHFALCSQHLSLEKTPQYKVSRLISLPFFHVFAALFVHVWPIRNRQPLYILPRFQLERFLTAVQRFQVTDTVVAPPIIHALNRVASSLGGRLDTIRWIGVGGAPISADAMQAFELTLQPHATLSQVWGMTEIGAATLVPYPERHCWGSIGRPLPGYEMQLVDGFGGIVQGDNEPGSLQVRYHGMMTGYKNQEPHPVDAWYDTGDIMTRENGKYFVIGRSKELIKVNGWQVAPAELETVLLTHPCIADVAVTGTLREDGVTEVPRAYIVRSTDEDGRCSTVSIQEIYDFARERLASYKALNGGILFIDSIPRTASGKIQRFKLARMDEYRRSITELLVGNNTNTGDSDMDRCTEQTLRKGIIDIKQQVESTNVDSRSTRRSARIAASATSATAAASRNGRLFPRTHSQKVRKRSRRSLPAKAAVS